jgi:hypothetical protein
MFAVTILRSAIRGSGAYEGKAVVLERVKGIAEDRLVPGAPVHSYIEASQK